MNRESHLRHSLPEWLKLEALDEIVIVDWSTREPLWDLIELDPRVRVIRAEGEPRWVLSYAYNLGIARARGDIILKCDSDCIPSAAVARLEPMNGHFFAGDWQTGNLVGKTCVNGQCVFSRAQWLQVNGYSELVRRYGYDDTDFYARLVAAGHERREVAPAELAFVEHSDADRILNQTRAAVDNTVEAFLNRQLHYHEAINIFITGLCPWGPWYRRAEYTTLEHCERREVVRRAIEDEIPLAGSLQQLARTHAIRTITARLCKIPPQIFSRMDETACLVALARLMVSKNNLQPALANSRL